MLVQRGIENFEDARAFFRPQWEHLHSPWLMKDMDKAVERILRALDQEEKILVYGDYDVDGTTSVACMVRFLRKRVARPELLTFYIPHRYREGYGVSQAGVDFAIQEGFTLVISLDCGIKAVKLVDYAQRHSIDFVICDHHLPDAELPRAAAILNAKQPDCPYPFKELCGCGVGLKLIQALCQRLELPHNEWQQLLDLVATAIAADIVPIIGENRVLAYFGLQKVNSQPLTGIKALMTLAKQAAEMHINNLVFVIAPRINAAGRMDDARKAVELFLTDDPEEAALLANALHEDNTERRDVDSSITEQAIAMIEADEQGAQRKSTLLYHPNWEATESEGQDYGKAKGVVGIVASRLIELYYRPTIILTDSGEKVAGSARSVTGFNIYEAIHQCADLLDSYGGHFYAAGLALKRERVAAFKERFEAVVNSTIEPHMLVPEIVIDAELSFADIKPALYKIIAQMEPFGPENMRPVFISRRVYETGESRIVKDLHIKFRLLQAGMVVDGIGFGMRDKFDLLQPNVPIDVVYTIEENEWNGEKRLQIRVIDLKPSGP